MYRIGMEHYGPYGENCINTGQFDAGECWLCKIKRQEKEVRELGSALKGLVAWSRPFVEETPISAETLWREFPAHVKAGRELLDRLENRKKQKRT